MDALGGWTTMIWAAVQGRVEVVRALLDTGAEVNEQPEGQGGATALWWACCEGKLPVVKLMMERGADPAIANELGSTPMMAATSNDHLEVVKFLLENPSGRSTIDHRNEQGTTWWACYRGRGAVARALLDAGADFTIPHNDGSTPMAIAKQPDGLPLNATPEGRKECVAALEVRWCAFFHPPSPLGTAVVICWLRRGVLSWAW
jgi:uncharacterized protein